MSVEINATNFPDAIFRQYISDNFDSNNDGILSDAEIAEAVTVRITNSNYETVKPSLSLQGISFLESLKDLSINGYTVSDIDLTENLEIENLHLINSLVVDLTIGSGPKLHIFSLYGSSVSFSSLTLDSYPDLYSVFIGDAEGLTDLTISDCPTVSFVQINEGSQIEHLSIDNCPMLAEFVSTLNNNDTLETVSINDCGIKYLYITGTRALVTVNLEGCINLETVYISGSYSLESIDFSGCNALTLILLINTGSPLETLDLTKCTSLKYLWLTADTEQILFGSNNNLRMINVSHCDNLTALNFPNSPSLHFIDTNYTGITSLDLSRAPILLNLMQTESPNIVIDYETQIEYYRLRRDSDREVNYELFRNLWLIAEYGGSPGVWSSEFAYKDAVLYAKTTVLNDGVPVILQEPSDLSLSEEDESGDFTVSASGNNLRYQWEKKPANSNLWETILGETTDTLTVQNDPEDNNSLYRCLIENERRSIYTREARLTIEVAPTIVSNPTSASLTEGETHTFSVEAEGNNLSYQWQSSVDGNTWTDIRYATNHEYEILATLALNGVQYRCTVTNQVGSVNSAAATLSVVSDTSLTAPEISINPTDVTANDGDVATFAVAADGDELTYQWQVQKNGAWQSIYGANGTTYTVNVTKALDGAIYRCQVANAAGAVYSLSAILTVISQSYITTPRVLTQPRSSTAALGDQVSFIVRADGGDLNYRWQKLNGGQWYDVTGEIGAIYTLTATSDLDGAQYRCIISNTAGSIATNIVTLTLQDTPVQSFYGYHSIIISGKNTYGEWEMYPTSRPHIAPPEVKTSYVDLPGADGGIDYTDLLTGEPRYGYRKGSWEFLLIPQDRWASVYRSLVNFLHGKVHTVILEDDPNYVYTGRLSVNEWQSAAHNSLITIDYILEPFPRNISGEDPSESDEEALNAAERLLRKPENAGMVIGIVNNTASVIDPAILFPDGDNIAY